MKESKIQRAVMRWWSMQHQFLGIKDERLLMAFPLAGKRNVVAGARLKAEGMRAGTPDMLLAVPRGHYHGLWIELKTVEGVISKSQKEFLQLLADQNYCAQLVYGFDDTLRVIQAYVGLK